MKKIGVYLLVVLILFLSLGYCYRDSCSYFFASKLLDNVAKKLGCKIKSIKAVKGGLTTGVTLNKVELLKDGIILLIEEVSFDITLLDLIWRKPGNGVFLRSLKIYQEKQKSKILEGFFYVDLRIKGLWGFDIGQVYFYVKDFLGNKETYKGSFRTAVNEPAVLNFKGKIIVNRHTFLKPLVFDLKASGRRLNLENISGNFFKGSKKFTLRGNISTDCHALQDIRLENLVIDNLVNINGRVEIKEKEFNLSIEGQKRDIEHYIEFISKVDFLPDVSLIKERIKGIAVGYKSNLKGWFDKLQIRGEGIFSDRKFSFSSEIKSLVNYSFSLKLNGQYEFQGEILNDRVDIECKFLEGDIKDTVLWGSPETQAWNPRGIVNGYINIKGRKSEVQTEGELELKGVKIKDKSFNYGTICLTGIGTLLNFENSKLYHDNNTLLVEGFVDLKEKNIFRNVKLVPRAGDTWYWQGIEFSRSDIKNTFKAKKDLNDNVSINLEQEQNSIVHDRDGSAELKLEYRLNGDQDLILKFNDREGSNMVGIKRSVSF